MSYKAYKGERLSVEALNRTRFNVVTNHAGLPNDVMLLTI